MPARASRRRDLHDHLVRSEWTHPHLLAARRRHPDWPTCGICGWVVDPAAGATHPGCTTREETTR